MQNLPSIKHMRIPNDRFCSFHIKQKAMGMVPSNSKVYGLTITIPSFFFEKEINMSTTLPNELFLNEILIRRKNKVLLFPGRLIDDIEQEYITTIMKNIESLGYTFSKDLFYSLQKYDKKYLSFFYTNLIAILRKLVGEDAEYKPMYPNFPEYVMNAESFDLYINAIKHYWSDGTFMPNEEKNPRFPLFDTTKVKVLEAGNIEDIIDIFNNLCLSKTSLSETDKNDLVCIYEYADVSFPNEIPLKENAAFIGKIYLEKTPNASAKDIQHLFKTSTDVLRLITAMSDGDISLASNTKFRSFKRQERVLLLELLENCNNITEDMLRYKNRWIRIGERLHPLEYTQFPKVTEAFNIIRNGKKFETFNGKLDRAITRNDYLDAIYLLVTRPGEFARKLDYLVRSSVFKDAIINSFALVAPQVSSPVLLQVKEHFSHRNDDKKMRVFFPKGNAALSHAVPNTLPSIDEKYCNEIVNICENTLIGIYVKKPYLGSVYISEDFKNYIVPFSQRSASKTTKTMTRGSRFKIDDSVKAIRAFIWWTNTTNNKVPMSEERVDIDLSASIFDENWSYMEHISYTNLKSLDYKAVHSGDIVNGGPIDGPGASEFLDIDIDSVVKHNARYVVFQVYSYTLHRFSELTHAMFGWMNREDVNSGEIYEPKTVDQKMDLTSKSTVSVPVIFDCVTREMIWADMNVSVDEQKCRSGNNLESNLTSVTAACYSIVNMVKPNLYDLINLHIRARGNRTYNKEEADIVFDINGDVTPYDTDVFVGEYL